jgi:hypothetical protein
VRDESFRRPLVQHSGDHERASEGFVSHRLHVMPQKGESLTLRGVFRAGRKGRGEGDTGGEAGGEAGSSDVSSTKDTSFVVVVESIRMNAPRASTSVVRCV